MGRGTVRPNIRPVRGPLRYETHEVRHLMGLHAQSLSMSAEAMNFGRANAMARMGVLLPRISGEMNKLNGLYRGNQPGMSGATAADANIPNHKLAELWVEMNKYRLAIEQIGDPFDRRIHVSNLQEVLDQQEERAKGLCSAGNAPPFHVIVSGKTMRAAGLSTSEVRAACDRGMAWRVWESRAWDPTALRANQAACARDQNLAMTGVKVPDPWLVKTPFELQRLSQYFGCRAP